MEYIVVTAGNQADLEQAVQARIAALWQLAPGFAVVVSQGRTTFYQPMVRDPLALPEAVTSPPPVNP